MSVVRWIGLLVMSLSVLCSGLDVEILKDLAGKPYRYAGRLSRDPVRLPVSYQSPRREMRGVWIATVENIDLHQHQKAKDFKDEFKALVGKLAERRFNAVFVQIRPANDAFYPSRLNPWSRFLTGTEGQGIKGFDPLKFMVKECHRRKLEFHGWLNPYRVIGETAMKTEDYVKTLDNLNFARQHPEFVLAAPRGGNTRLLFLNPGEPKVIEHVVDTVKEIISNYDVDAIHFDDYFYPYSAFGMIDEETFKQRGKGKKIDDWRRDNVTALIKDVRKAVREHNRKNRKRVQFGVSPFGIWANRNSRKEGSLTLGKQSYFAQFADTRKWLREGLVDYLIPQLYWQFGHDVAAYACLADWWADQAKASKARLYIGMAPYRLGRDGWKDPMELANQMRYNRKHKSIRGQVFFSASNVIGPGNDIMKKGLDVIWQTYWTETVKTPAIPRK